MISYNMDMKKGLAPLYGLRYECELTASEDYDAELERMNSAMIEENQTLQHDNKQLNALIKEYETTLETVMSLFRQRAVGLPSLFDVRY
jgi:SIKE family